MFEPMHTFTFTDPDGFTIVGYAWMPPTDATPRAILQIIHGASEHALRYERLAHALNQAGYIVYAYDQRGHGRTAAVPEKAGIAGPDGWNGMVKDARQMTDLIRQQHPDLPLFLFGHSMGSLLAQSYMQQWGDQLGGVILSGASGLIPDLDQAIALAEQAAQGAAAYAPSVLSDQMFAALNAPFAPGKTGFEWLSRDEAEVQNYVDDPWCGRPLSNRLVADLFAGARQIWQPANEARIPKHLPILAIAGEKDPVSGNTLTVRALLDRYTQLDIMDVAHKFYPDARHELLHECNRDEVHRDLIDWLHLHHGNQSSSW
jgi:alpha-beta hydrolase superfamily lysophospholipase